MRLLALMVALATTQAVAQAAAPASIELRQVAEIKDAGNSYALALDRSGNTIYALQVQPYGLRIGDVTQQKWTGSLPTRPSSRLDLESTLAISRDGSYLAVPELVQLGPEPATTTPYSSGVVWALDAPRVLSDSFITLGVWDRRVVASADLSRIVRFTSLQIRIFDRDTGKGVRDFAYERPSDEERYAGKPSPTIQDVVIAPDGSVIIALVRMGVVHQPEADGYRRVTTRTHLDLWDVETGRHVRRMEVGHGEYKRLYLSQSGKRLAAVPYYGLIQPSPEAKTRAERQQSMRPVMEPIKVWDASSWTLMAELPAPRSPNVEYGELPHNVRGLVFLSDDRYLAWVAAHVVTIWSVEQGQITSQRESPWARATALSGDGSRLAVAGAGCVRVFELVVHASSHVGGR